jgi:hypothetical protein
MHAKNNIKSSMFSIICGRYTFKLNVYMNTFMIIYIYIYIYIYMYILHTDRKNKIILVYLSEGTTSCGRGKVNARG